MPFCPACGKEVSTDFRACPNCGQLLQPVSESPPAVPTPQPVALPPTHHRRRNIIITVVVVLLVVFVVLPAIGYYYGAQTQNIYLTNVTYNYYCSNCASTNWSYSVPVNSSVAAGSTFSGTAPFSWPSYQTCSVTLTDTHATTPGFQYSISPLPLTISPGQNISATYTMTTPSQAYSGPVDISATLNLNC